jgi:alpha-tubulin suppressor-like RCC1 family protein
VACGAHHSLMLLENGEVYAFGSNSEGQLGIDANHSFRPIRVAGLEHVTHISAGDLHSAALSAGVVYTWGAGKLGQLGHCSFSSCPQPQPIALLQEFIIAYVSCGPHSTSATTDDGVAYIWGGNCSQDFREKIHMPRVVREVCKSNCTNIPDLVYISKVKNGHKHHMAFIHGAYTDALHSLYAYHCPEDLVSAEVVAESGDILGMSVFVCDCECACVRVRMCLCTCVRV